MKTARAFLTLLLLGGCPRVSGERMTTLERENAEQRQQIEKLESRLDRVERFLDDVTGGKFRTAQPPDPTEVYSVPVAGDPVKGPATALVTVVEIAEFG